MTRRLCLFVFACVHPEKLKFSLFSCVNIFGRKQNRLHSLSVTSRPPKTKHHTTRKAGTIGNSVAAPRTRRRRAGATEPGGLPAVFTPVLERPSPGPLDNCYIPLSGLSSAGNA